MNSSFGGKFEVKFLDYVFEGFIFVLDPNADKTGIMLYHVVCMFLVLSLLCAIQVWNLEKHLERRRSM